MLFGTIVTWLFVSIGISRIQAKAIGDQRVQQNNTQTSVNGGNSVIEAVHNNNILNTGPNEESMYGSIVKVENNTYESTDRRRPTITETRTDIAPGGPGYDGVYYVKLKEHDHQGQPKNSLSSRTYMSGNTFNIAPGTKLFLGSSIEKKDNVYKLRGSNYQTQPNEEHIFSNEGNGGLNVDTILTNNVIQTIGGNMEINVGSSITYNGNVHIFDKNSTTRGKTINNKRQDDSSDELYKLLEIVRASQKSNDDWQNQYFGNEYATGKANSSYTIHDSYPDSQIEKYAQDMEKEAYPEKHSESNEQTSLSSNIFYPLTYFLIILIKESVLN